MMNKEEKQYLLNRLDEIGRDFHNLVDVPLKDMFREMRMVFNEIAELYNEIDELEVEE